MNILIFGAGYVGYSLAIFLADTEHITVVETDKKKINFMNEGKPCINDLDFVFKDIPKVNAKYYEDEWGQDFDFIIIAVPTDYKKALKALDTKLIEEILDEIQKRNIRKPIIIKSTVPIGFTASMVIKYPTLSIIYMPEFVREGHTIEDNLNPSRIIYGIANIKDKIYAVGFSNLLRSKTKNMPEVMEMSSSEAEAVKLFANTYLAMRITFFNELDSYSILNKLDSKKIIHGICSDDRIGDYYNNPSFGFGGYCLPKDSMQLEGQLDFENSSLIRSINRSNEERLKKIVNEISMMNITNIGIYRLKNKIESNSIKDSVQIKLAKKLKNKFKVMIYEPLLTKNYVDSIPIINDLRIFKKNTDLIITNGIDSNLTDVLDKIYTRSIY